MLFTHCRFFPDNTSDLQPDGAVLIENGLIADIGTSKSLMSKHRKAERVDAGGQLLMPGMVNAHTHFYGAFARGMAVPGNPPADFPAVLRQLWWNLDKALDAETVRLSALVSLADAIRSGVTTLIDHHASPNAIDGSLDIIADAVRQAGVRAALCYEVTDRDGADKAQAGIAENVRFLTARQQASDRDQIAGLFGLHASMTLSDRTLRAAAAANTFGVGFHIHVAEHEADQIDSLAKSGMRVVNRLSKFGILNEKSIAAHCIHLDAEERALLKAANPWVTHQARSNMNNGVGAMDFDGMTGAGQRVALGSDGFFGSMWEEMKAVYFLHKQAQRDPRAANGGAVAEAMARNQALAGSIFGGTFGKLSKGARADLILVDYQPYTPLTAGNLAWHILFGMEASLITTTIAGGRILMRDRVLLTLDERAIAAAGRELAPALWARCAANAKD